MFLLDTNALLFAAFSGRSLSRVAADILENDKHVLLVSAVSAWEIATKVRLGKLTVAVGFEARFLEEVSKAGYVLLPIGVDHALRAGRLIGAHKDPFDRMIAAQAIALDIPVISSDAKLDGFGVRRIW